MLDDLVAIERGLITLKLKCGCDDDLDQLNKVIKELDALIDMCIPL